MRHNGFKLVVAIWIVLFASVYLCAGESKGYKIILASSPVFDEAKEKLQVLGSKIGEEERSLQTKYGFEIAARPSGKVFMLAIEPLKTKEDADAVLKRFKRLYPDAYINGYFGPTKGSVFLEQSVSEAIEETKQAVDVSKTEHPLIASEENTTAATAIESLIEEQALQKETKPNESTRNSIVVIGLSIGLIILYTFWYRFKGRSTVVKISPKKSTEEHVTEDTAEMTEAEAEMEETPSVIENITEEKSEISDKVFEPVPDVFYKLKKNLFFMTLMGELKEASDSQNEQRCRDLMGEVLRYQKNFRQSDMIARMEQFIEVKEFKQLSEFINSEMD